MLHVRENKPRYGKSPISMREQGNYGARCWNAEEQTVGQCV